MSDYELEFLERPQRDPKRSRRQPQKRRAAPPRKKRSCLGRLFRLGLSLLFIGFILGLISAVGGYLYLSSQLEEAIAQVSTYQGQGVGGTPRFYDRNGTLLLELTTVEKRRWLSLQDVPQHLIDATIAVEDDTFWDNYGFDPAAIGAALLYNYQNQGARPVGASTITQQLVRHIAFSYEERVGTSYERKLREIFLAFVMTQKRTKPEILQMYLNEIYYGNLAYGIEAAAQTYFGKSAANLNIAEATFLAGLPQAPIQWDPYTNFEGAKVRQEMIIDLMFEDGVINELDVQVAKGVQLELVPRIQTAAAVDSDNPLLAPHFVLYVQDEIERRYGPDALVRDGWQVTTTLDLNIHSMAEQVLREQVAQRAAEHNVSNGAVVVMKPATSEILAMVGSIDYFNEEIDGQFNMSVAPRQPGSSFKPITYAAAMENGWNTGDVIWDVPIELEVGLDNNMTPVNYDGRYHGPLLLRDALANSYNIPPLQLAREIGLNDVIQMGRKLGVTSLNQTPGYYGLSLTLGGGEVPLVEMTHAFSTLANQGRFLGRTSILQITDSRGNVIYDAQRNRLPPNQVVDPGIAYIISDILDDDAARVPAMGRGSALELPFPAAVKTGTTNDFRDNLTIGYTPGLAVGVWLGNTDSRPMRDSSGLRGAAPVWARIVQNVYADGNLGQALLVDGAVPPLEFQRPSNVEEKAVCLPRGTGGTSCTASRNDLFLINAPLYGIGRLGYRPDARSVPGAWVVTVLPLSSDVAQQINLPPINNGFAMPTPTLCVVNSSSNIEGAQTRVMLPVPPFYPDEVRARLWAQRNGRYQMAPPTACPSGVLRVASGGSTTSGGTQATGSEGGGAVTSGGGTSAGGGSGGSNVWRISSPGPGAQLSGSTPIIGTVSASDMQYYKLEIGSGRNPTQWTTFGTTHSNPVSNGTLETLQAGGLPAGDYVIRLVVVKQDGNFSNPYSVPITIVK